MLKRAKLFFRGIRLRGCKDRTSGTPVTPLPPPDEVRIALKQHIGKAAIPAVMQGQTVKRGQPIALADGEMSANLHASVAGVVKSVERDVIVIERQGDEEFFYPPLREYSQAAIRERIFEAGIVGMGGAGFPTHIKAAPKEPINTLIINGAECEPYLTCDDRIMQERRDEIVRGAHYLCIALGASRAVIGIEKNKPRAIALYKETDLEVVVLKKRYPMGSERHIIYCCTGRKVPLRALPAAVGVCVQNAGTALAVCEAVESGKPLIERVVTVSGGGTTKPANLLVPIGTPLEYLARLCGMKDETAKLIAGGPMTGVAMPNFNDAVTKTTSGLLLFTAEETNAEPPTPCINCGKCAAVCPMKLMPMQTEFYTAAKQYENADKYGGVLSCIDCGACTYICPARRPLAQAIRTAKSELKRSRA